MNAVPEPVLNSILSLTSLSSCTWGASSVPKAAVAIAHCFVGVGVSSFLIGDLS